MRVTNEGSDLCVAFFRECAGREEEEAPMDTVREHRDFVRAVIGHQRVKKMELAEAAGVTSSAVSKFIIGQNTIALDKLMKLAPVVVVNQLFLAG
jgi:hypothetical protein